MLQQKGIFTKFRQKGIGPGGWDCESSAPAPKHRRVWCRWSKKAMYRYLDRTDMADLGE